jgi:hypothetical protein
LAPWLTHRDIVTGWEVVAMVGVFVVPVTAYGAFIFHRALKITAEINKGSGSVGLLTTDGDGP